MNANRASSGVSAFGEVPNKKFLNKLNKYSNKKLAKVNKNESLHAYELFEQAISKKRKVKLIFKNHGILDCIPLTIEEIDGKTFFCVFNKRKRMIESSRVNGIQVYDSVFADPYDGKQVAVFRLTGNLAKRYSLRPNETMDIESDGSIIITNRNENKNMLLSRLLRYQDSCELIQPKAYRDEFKQLISDTLKNYGIDT